MTLGLPDKGQDANNLLLDTPRCIPLHGRIDSCYCPLCHYSYPMIDHTDSFIKGQFPSCEHCLFVESMRPFTEKRSRGIGELRPSIILYGEEHPSGEAIGRVLMHDLNHLEECSQSGGSVLVMVVGTSLKVAGIKTMVRDFSKVHRAEQSTSVMDAQGHHGIGATSVVKCIYLSMEYPSPSRQWEGVFDTWLYGDLQQFARLMLGRQKVDRGISSFI
jgi:NAD-dependent SIR2 family protein deacetylase